MITFVKATSNCVAAINGKLYNCQVIGTIYKAGKKPIARIKVAYNGEDVEMLCNPADIHKDFDAYASNKNCIEPYEGRLIVVQNGVKFPFTLDEDAENTLLVECWIDSDEGAKKVSVRLTDFEVNAWGYYIQTKQLPADAQPTKKDIIRVAGTTMVDTEGNESTIGGVVKRVQTTDAQIEALKVLEDALKQCKDAGVQLVYSQESARLHAVNRNDNKLSFTYYDDDEMNDYNYVNVVECREVESAAIQYLCEDDVIIVQ